MFDFQQIKELIGSIDNSEITSFELSDKNGEKLVIKKEPAQPITVSTAIAPAISPVMPQAAPVAQPAPSPVAASAPAAEAPVEAKQQEDNCRVITSPMVGVFYSAPSPDADPYVSVGQTVKNGDIVCIIEAMKLMNEIPATESGTIAEICVKNGDIVEYGQPLFKIK
ncbi:acetyl-CoA carboxylase biotin carboxyl carrier protein [Ruminococcus sp. zg-924]|nr:acetyl-CoA carboxylase biotin carboxyl carrier protein [Ruminococcus sp. zg-924]MCQ4114536.1 acetyl-CoA carboxylase biotin carboxyl carrier protein [Ruminococcus sp. zg-921]